MKERKPWQPRLRREPIFNPFERPTDRTRNLGANDRVEIQDEDVQPDEASDAVPHFAEDYDQGGAR